MHKSNNGEPQPICIRNRKYNGILVNIVLIDCIVGFLGIVCIIIDFDNWWKYSIIVAIDIIANFFLMPIWDFPKDKLYIRVDSEGIFLSGYELHYGRCQSITETSIFLDWANIKGISMGYIPNYEYTGYRDRCLLSIEISTSLSQKKISRFIRGEYVNLNPRIIKHLIAAIEAFSEDGTVVEWKGKKSQF